MGLYSTILHLANFLAPALWMALAFPTIAALLGGAARAAWNGQAWKRQVGTHLLLGSAVLVMGLLVLGRDGKMATYLALVIVGATVQTVFGCRGRA
ncbi:hypothetical protein [Candidatus Symbiobacter mobilis]|uniref:Uncharacterized protein n=1 Tax=Candidatus Symbiobacter mobilis CR TaxID=946483 RepID=U5N9V6_9BURK|nr:hypothetical protein [Candidatus Symbiobacter mobilis]AGX88192.1 hypothetical protein Cenrod_2121 [Candidatus Symbiobacter mobilis CR]